MSTATNAALNNRLLRSLPRSDFEKLQPHMEVVELQFGEVLHDPGSTLRHVYFPETAVISMIIGTLDGASVEVGMIGRQGMSGVRAFLGADTAPHAAIVQIAGSTIRLSSKSFKEVCQSCEVLPALVMRQAHILITQISQAAACHSLHTVKGRLSRWLLELRDRTDLQQFSFTHQSISSRLGVRREAVTMAARSLQRTGLIRYSRGRIELTDAKGLRELACECYSVLAGLLESAES
ncbi:MAG TPA: Crp/Fnr family transcriptional regulator [Blastocatellia bacterium]|nr:Crp/Fnr family transcriptional regulator [Blastocatellia bacterium]